MELKPGNAQFIGSRQEQEDAFGFYGYGQDNFSNHGGVLTVLADGMGGLSRGREASHLAVKSMMAAYGEKTAGESIPNALVRALVTANQAVYDLACATNGEGQIGSTLVAAVIWEQALYWVSVGDSRLYIMRAEEISITQCTQDHNLGSKLLLQVASGDLSREQALEHPNREALTSFLGLESIPKIDNNVRPLVLRHGDRVMLCSDGIHGTLSDKELSLLLKNPDVQVAAEAVIGEIKQRAIPNQDNATIALLEYQEQIVVTMPAVGDSNSKWLPNNQWQVPLGVTTALVIGSVLGWNLARVGTESGAVVSVLQATSPDQSIALPLPPETTTILPQKDANPNHTDTTDDKSGNQQPQNSSPKNEAPATQNKSNHQQKPTSHKPKKHGTSSTTSHTTDTDEDSTDIEKNTDHNQRDATTKTTESTTEDPEVPSQGKKGAKLLTSGEQDPSNVPIRDAAISPYRPAPSSPRYNPDYPPHSEVPIHGSESSHHRSSASLQAPTPSSASDRHREDGKSEPLIPPPIPSP